MAEPVKTKSYLWTAIASLCSLLVLFLMLYVFAPLMSVLVINTFDIKDLDTMLVADSIISFGILCMVFFVLLYIKKIHSLFVIVFCVITLFLFWGIESSFFWEGFNPMYPLWYEVEMALNDALAALFSVSVFKLINKR